MNNEPIQFLPVNLLDKTPRRVSDAQSMLTGVVIGVAVATVAYLCAALWLVQ